MSPRPRKRPARPDAFTWLDLVETEGPFLSRPALRAAFPDGLAHPDAQVDQVGSIFRTGFSRWEKAWTAWRSTVPGDARARARYLAERDTWVRTVVRDVLEWNDHYREGSGDLRARSLDGSVTIEATGRLVTVDTPEALLLVVDPTEDLSTPGSDGWAATAIDRGAALLRTWADAGMRVPVVVVTDGRWWSLVWTSEQGATGYGTFDGGLFREEPDLRDGFWALARLTSLAGGTPERRLPALLAMSVASAEEITDAMGAQVRAAVELLVQSFSASHLQARAAGEPTGLPSDGHEIYDAAVTMMMRVVFLLFAEANELLPTGELFQQAYGISDVADRLDKHRLQTVAVEGEESLEATYDTWHRLLATSRALFEGATFEDLRMPAYGGSLFDPQRFAWLTATDPATGRLRILVDDRVMLHVLRAVQHVTVNGEDRQVSFRELDVEQIGYVYEGLLGYSARFTGPDQVTVALDGPEAGSEPEIPLDELHRIADEAGEDGETFARLLLAWVKENQPGARPRTGRQIARAYDDSGQAAVQQDARRRLRPVVGPKMTEELVGYITLIRDDLRGLPYVVPGGGLVVVETPSRATSGTHYTPRSLAEDVVHHALEPLVYSPGPLQMADTTAWVPISSTDILELKVADIAVGSGAFLVAAARYLGARLLEAWEREGITREDSTAEQRRQREVEARREVIAHCLYGADINPMAVEMCKLSLWLVSLDPARPFSFVDDKILCGNSLLGLTELRQLRGLHIDPSPTRLSNPGLTVDVDAVIDRATELRHQLATPVSDADTMRSTRAKLALMHQLHETTARLRTVADAVIASGLPLGGKPGRALDRAYEHLSYALLLQADHGDPSMLESITGQGLTPTVETDYDRWKPLHWLIELPDVMLEHGGFDAVVGNPPFLGGKKISPAMGQNLRLWFVNQLAGGTAGNADLVAYFFLRAVSLLRPHRGQLGLIATNTIAQGDTREVGLDQLATRGIIRRCIQSRPWPARSAQLQYSTVWLSRAALTAQAAVVANSTRCTRISTLLEPEGRMNGHPFRLIENLRKSFVGSNVNGTGFVISPELAERMISAEPRNAEVIRYYIRSNEVNSSPDHHPTAMIIAFGSRSEQEAAVYREPFEHLRKYVKPHRDAILSKRRVRNNWWQFESSGARLYAEVGHLSQVMCLVQTSKTLLSVFMSPKHAVFTHKLVVIASQDAADLAVLSSGLHIAWALQRGSSMKSDPVYTPSDVFQTFPRPVSTTELSEAGHVLDQERREIMLRRNLGLTKLYNLVNDPDVQRDQDVDRMREIHIDLDKAVVQAYGWDDVPLGHGFHTYRQMQRFTISPDARVELLDRLLEENHRRAALHGDVGAPRDDDDEAADQEEDL